MIILSSISIIIILYFLCRTIISKSVRLPNSIRLFNIAFTISIIAVVVYSLIDINILNPNWVHNITGIVYKDESSYHRNAIIIANNFFEKPKYLSGDHGIVWQYIIAIPYYFLGNYPILAKLINAALFATSSIFIYAISLHQFKVPYLAKKSYYLFLLFLPLLIHYNGSLLKESFLAFITIINIYLYQLINSNRKIKYFIFLLIGFLIMFLTRHQYSMILALSMIFGILFGNRNLSNKMKFYYTAIIILIFLIISQLIFKSNLLFLERFGDTYKGLRTSAYSRITIEGSYFDYFLEFLKNPFLFTRQIIYGIIMIVFHPFPWQIINPTRTIYAIWAAYNFFFYICIPFIFFGLIYKKKMLKLNHIDYTILIYWLGCFLAITLNGRDPFRYRVSFFPLLFIYIPYGRYYYYKWRKKAPLILFIIIIILFFASTIDFYKLTGLR